MGRTVITCLGFSASGNLAAVMAVLLLPTAMVTHRTASYMRLDLLSLSKIPITSTK